MDTFPSEALLADVRTLVRDSAHETRGAFAQADAQRERAEWAEAEVARLKAVEECLIDEKVRHARTRRRLRNLVEEKDGEVGILRAYLQVLAEDASRLGRLESAERALAFLAVREPCAPCAERLPGSCRDLFEGPA